MLGTHLSKQTTCDCGFMVRTASDDEFVKHVQLHAQEVHSMEVTREQALARAQTIEAGVDV